MFVLSTKIKINETRPSWLNCALRGNETVYWVSIGQQWFVLGGTISQNKDALVGNWWCLVSIWRYWLVLVCTGSLGQCWAVLFWYLVVLGQYRAVLLGIRWYWVSIGGLWLYIDSATQLLRSRSGALLTQYRAHSFFNRFVMKLANREEKPRNHQQISRNGSEN